MQVILLERISRLGKVGDVVKVRDGFGRNFLIPQNKALRATKANLARFEAERDVLEKKNADSRAVAEKEAAKLKDVAVTVVRQASEDGKLYGSVTPRDVADALAKDGHKVERRQIDLNATIKNIGLYKVSVNLHPEVHAEIKVNVARNADSPLPSELYGEEKAVAEERPAKKAAKAEEAPAEEASESPDGNEEDAA